MEILLGCVQPMSDEIREVIAHFETEYRSILKVYPLNVQETQADLAQKSKRTLSFTPGSRRLDPS